MKRKLTLISLLLAIIFVLSCCGMGGGGTTDITIRFDTDGAGDISSYTYTKGDTITLPTEPTKEGYTFLGWYYDSKLRNPFDAARNDYITNVTLYAKWQENTPVGEPCTVTFECNGGSAVNSQEITSGENATRPVNPTKDNYNFAGWFSDASCTTLFDFDSPINADITLYAGWTTRDCAIEGHSYSITSVEGGEITYTCEYCNDEYTEETSAKGDYYFNYQATYENGEDRQDFYNEILVKAIEFSSNEETIVASSLNEEEASKYIAFTLDYTEYDLSVIEALEVFRSFLLDCPEFFWFSSNISHNNTSIYFQVNEEYANGTTRKTAYDGVKTTIDTYLDCTEGAETDLDKMLALHDYIIELIDYAYEDDGVTPSSERWAHTIMGAFDEDILSGVCECYAKTYQLLLNCLNIDNVVVVGEVNSTDIAIPPVGHMWNLVKLGNDWYYMDLTWDEDSTNGVRYTYFGVAEDIIESERTITEYPSDNNSAAVALNYVCPLPSGISNENIAIANLKEGETNLGDFLSISKAYEAMTDTTADYTITLGSFSGANFVIPSGDTPTANSITFVGNLSVIDEDSFDTIKLNGNVTAKANLIFENVILSANSSQTLSLGEKSIEFGGFFCRVDIISIVGESASTLKLSVTGLGSHVLLNTNVSVGNTTYGTECGVHLRGNSAATQYNLGNVNLEGYLIIEENGHTIEVNIGDYTTVGGKYMLVIVADEDYFPDITISGTLSGRMYYVFRGATRDTKSCSLDTYDGVLFNAPNLTISNSTFSLQHYVGDVVEPYSTTGNDCEKDADGNITLIGE